MSVDLSKMSVAEMDDWIGAASTPDLETVRLSTCYNELARRHAAVTAERDRLARQWFDGEQWVELDPDEVKRRREEAGRKLDWTADGVPVVPLDTVWVDPDTDAEVCGGGKIAWYAVGDSNYGTTPAKHVAVSKCYSTREAAQRGGEVGSG